MICCSIVLASAASAQIDSQYVITFGANSFEEGVAAGIDASGNGYYLGYFQSDVDFDPDTASTHILTGSRADVYVASYTSTGGLRFAFDIGNRFATSEYAGDLAVRPNGTIAVTGAQPFGTIDYDPDTTATVELSGRVFVASYDSAGHFIFASAAAALDAASTGRGESVAFDRRGNVYATGAFVGTLDFAGSTFTGPGVLTSVDGSDIFVVSYTADGDFRFAFSIDGEGSDRGLGIAVDSTANIFLTGDFGDELHFDRDDTDLNGDTERRTSAGSSDLFLASYDSLAVFRFAFALGGEFDDVGEGVDVDEAGLVYITGKVAAEVDFDPGPIERLRAGSPNGSAFLASYLNTGVFRYAVVLEGGSSTGRDVSTTAEGKSIIVGSFGGEIDLDPGDDEALFTSVAGSDAFAARYSLYGNYILGYALQGAGSSDALGVDLNADEGHVITGAFTGSIDFDPTDGSDVRTGNGQTDGYIARYPATFIVSNESPVVVSGPHDELTMSSPYPNPAYGPVYFTIDAAELPGLTLTIHDVTGRRVWVPQLRRRAGRASVEVQLDTSRLASGVYLIVARSGEKIGSHRVVVYR